MEETLLVFSYPHWEAKWRPTMTFEDVIYEDAETQAPYMTDDPDWDFNN